MRKLVSFERETFPYYRRELAFFGHAIAISCTQEYSYERGNYLSYAFWLGYRAVLVYDVSLDRK